MGSGRGSKPATSRPPHTSAHSAHGTHGPVVLPQATKRWKEARRAAQQEKRQLHDIDEDGEQTETEDEQEEDDGDGEHDFEFTQPGCTQ